MRVQRWIRYGSYPAVMLPALFVVAAVASGALPTWPVLALVSAAGIACVAFLERFQPYERDWLRDHGEAFVAALKRTEPTVARVGAGPAYQQRESLAAREDGFAGRYRCCARSRRR
jgi:hypothetical protein